MSNRPQAPGYLANLLARLFHEVSAEGLGPLGIRAEQFPVLVELWFGDGPVTRASLRASQEADAAHVDALLRSLAEDGLIAGFPSGEDEGLVLTDKAKAARDPAIAAARRANDAARAVLSEDEMALFMEMMNRVIEGLMGAKSR